MEYGMICHEGTVVDEVMLCVMLAPRSFTREDVVEIYTHGAQLSVGGVLQAVLAAGARCAEPGEFTRRAFVNGRINLTQAEAVMDIIHAGSEAARSAGLRQLGGGLSARIAACRDVILRWLAHISLSVDYPEHEEEAANRGIILGECPALLADMRGLLESARVGRVLREGVKTAIAGAPNAGKSTLLNAILGEERAITHDAPGTTRDTLTESAVVGGVQLVLTDTAGLREAENAVEQMGVARSHRAISEAELILWVADSTKGQGAGGVLSEINELTAALDHDFNGKKIIVLMNKADLVGGDENATQLTLPGTNRPCPVFFVSAKTGQGMSAFFSAIKEVVFDSESGENTAAAHSFDPTQTDIITRERHRALLSQAIEQVEKAQAELTTHIPEDMIAITLRGAYLSLGHILGEEYSDDIIERIFADFCVGK
jgi:tRNA modification GTPase